MPAAPADGTIPAASVERLLAIGAWLDTNGVAIHGTVAGPYRTLPWGRCTMRQSTRTTTLYLHVFAWPEDDLVVPGIGNTPVRAWLLAEPDRARRVGRDGADLWIDVPPHAPDRASSVVALEIEGAPVVNEAPVIVAPAPRFVRPPAVDRP